MSCHRRAAVWQAVASFRQRQAGLVLPPFDLQPCHIRRSFDDCQLDGGQKLRTAFNADSNDSLTDRDKFYMTGATPELGPAQRSRDPGLQIERMQIVPQQQAADQRIGRQAVSIACVGNHLHQPFKTRAMKFQGSEQKR